jgi:hypothetical protein
MIDSKVRGTVLNLYRYLCWQERVLLEAGKANLAFDELLRGMRDHLDNVQGCEQ